MGMNIGDMRLDMTQDVECIINDINSQNIGFKHLEKDSLSIDTSNSIVVDLVILQLCKSSGVAGMWIFRVGLLIICI